MTTCEQGMIASARSGREDRGILTSTLLIGFGPKPHDMTSAQQGFGGLRLTPELLVHWERDLCLVFGVTRFEDLVGQECWALRSFPGFGTPVEGLANAEGTRRFTLTGFLRRYVDPETRSPFDVALSASLDEVKETVARLERLEAEPRRLRETYVDWLDLTRNIPTNVVGGMEVTRG